MFNCFLQKSIHILLGMAHCETNFFGGKAGEVTGSQGAGSAPLPLRVRRFLFFGEIAFGSQRLPNGPTEKKQRS
jgi:hypothetical protein